MQHLTTAHLQASVQDDWQLYAPARLRRLKGRSCSDSHSKLATLAALSPSQHGCRPWSLLRYSHLPRQRRTMSSVSCQGGAPAVVGTGRNVSRLKLASLHAAAGGSERSSTQWSCQCVVLKRLQAGQTMMHVCMRCSWVVAVCHVQMQLLTAPSYRAARRALISVSDKAGLETLAEVCALICALCMPMHAQHSRTWSMAGSSSYDKLPQVFLWKHRAERSHVTIPFAHTADPLPTGALLLSFRC